MAEVKKKEPLVRSRPRVVHSVTIRKKTGCDNLYAVITYDEMGALEVFSYLGKAGQCNNCMLESLTRAVTAGLRRGIPLEVYVKALSDIRCEKPVLFPKKSRATSCSDALAVCLKRFLKEEPWKHISTMEKNLSEE